MDNVAAQIADYKMDVRQAMLLAILKGVFSMKQDTSVAGKAAKEFLAKHVYDITVKGAEAGLVGSATLNKAIQQACGDNKNIFKLVIMHSEVATNLENIKLLKYMTQTDGDGIERELALATWNGVIAALIAYAAISGIVAAVNGVMALSASVHAAAEAMQAGATFTATAAQYGLNAALMACPLTWIILLIIAVIAAIFAVCNAIAKMTGVANSGFGVITGGINVVIQFFKNLGLSVANIALGIGNAIAALASNMMTAFHNAICNVQSWFYNLLSTALTVIEGICAALNKLPFVEFDYSGISSAADDYASKAAEAAGNKEDYKSIGDAFNEGMSTFDTFQDGWAADAFNAGASWGDGVADKVSGMFSMDNIDLTGGVDTSMLSNDFANNAAQTAANTADTADSAGRIADSVDISKENLKYLRDIAETEAINRFTTAEIEVTMNNNNTVSSDMDIDGMVDHLSAGVLEAMEQAAEGVH